MSIVDMRSLSCWGGGGVDGVHQELMAAKFTVCLCVFVVVCVFLLHKKHHFWCHKGTIYNGFLRETYSLLNVEHCVFLDKLDIVTRN